MAVRNPEPIRLHRVVRELSRDELFTTAGRKPELRRLVLLAEAPHPPPDPWHEVAPVIEVEVRDRDRVHLRPAVHAEAVSQSRENSGPAVEQEPPRALEQISGLRSAGVGPSGGAPDDSELHRHSVPRRLDGGFNSNLPRFGLPILPHVAGKIRVVIAKPGLDGHDRGAKIIARALRDAGMEVVYTGLHQTPEQIVETAIQEDADAVGISILSGAHMTLVPKILEGLRENGVEDVLVVVGGTIPRDDVEELKRRGVAEVFTPGAPVSQIVDFLKSHVPVEA